MPDDKLVVLQGLNDYIVVESDNILLICKKEDEQKKPAKRPAKPGVTGKIGDAAAALTGLDWLKGEEVTFQQEQVYVVEFWAT